MSNDKKGFEDLGALCNGCHLYREPDGAGGYKYMSDEIGGGVSVWVTSLVSEETLLAAICCEHNRKYQAYFKKTRPDLDLSEKMQMEQCAATGGSLIPKEVLRSTNEDNDFEDDISNWLKIRAVRCYLAYTHKDNKQNTKKVTAVQFDEYGHDWKKHWIRVARVNT